MRLYLMRHGIAIDHQDPDCPADEERYLTAKGVERTRAAAEGLLELNVKPTRMLTSPYVRAVQTGEIVCEVLDVDPKQMSATEALKSDAKSTRLAEELSRLGDENVMCFGHAPQIDEFIAHAVRASAAFTAIKKAGVACLEVDDFAPLRATLAWLMTSRALRHLKD